MSFVRVNPTSKFKDILNECIQLKKVPLFVPININQSMEKILQDETFNMDFSFYKYIYNMESDILKVPVKELTQFVYCEIFRFKKFENFIQMYSKLNPLGCTQFNVSGYYDNHQFILIVACLTDEIITFNNMIKKPYQFRTKLKKNEVFCFQMNTDTFFARFTPHSTATCTCCRKQPQHFFVKYNSIWGHVKIKGSWHIFFTKDHILFQEDV